MLKKIITSIILLVIIITVGYFTLPAVNFHSPGFWYFLIFAAALFMIVFGIADYNDYLDNDNSKANFLISRIAGVTAIGLTAVFAITAVAGSHIFNAVRYSEIRTMKYVNFSEAMPETEISQVIAVDRDTAEKYGARKLGTLTEYLSQYKIGNYTQINYNNSAVRISPLNYASIFKWNHKIPGYISVNCNTGDSEFIACEMKLTENGYFNENLRRICRFKYPTCIFGEFGFEIDDNGNPYFIAPVYKYTIGLMGGKDVSGIILVNAATGGIEKIDMADVPTWIDHVYDGLLTSSQINYNLSLKNGFWNSVIGQKNVAKTTEGYGYINRNNDIYLYTGVTSTVMTDESNIGFVLANMRTGETEYIECPSAEEYSAMDTSKGVVQEKGYEASFPVLININDQPVYFLTLKDSAGLIKAYSLVDAQNYTKVYVESTIEEAWKKFTSNVSHITTNPEDITALSVTIKEIIPVVMDGNTIYYMTFENNDNIFTANIQISNHLPFIKTGDNLEVETIGNIITSITTK